MAAPEEVGHGKPGEGAPRSESAFVLSGDLLRELVARYEASWNARDVDGFLACHTEDAVWEMPLIYPDGVARGHAAIALECQRAWRGLTDIRFSTHDLFVSLDGRRAAQLWTGRGILTGVIDPPGYAPTNQPVEMTGVSIWEFSGRCLSRVTEYFDTIAVGRQIGLIPAPGTASDRIGIFLQHIAARRLRRRS
jgi:ketosteroid isomerase-like protein